MDALSRGTVAAFAQPPNVKISPAVPETVTVCVYRFETIPLPVRCSAFVSSPPRVSPAADHIVDHNLFSIPRTLLHFQIK